MPATPLRRTAPGPRPHRGWVALAAALLATLVGLACQGSTEARLAELQAMQQAGEFAQTIGPLREILATRPDEADANYLLGVALLQTGRASQAIFPLEKAASSGKHAIAAGITLAATLYNTENYERAIDVATQLLERDPELLTALNVRAQSAISTGHPQSALEDAERLLALRADDFTGHTLKVAALVDLERYDEAEQVHVRMNELAAEMGDADLQARSCAGLGKFLSGREQHDEATKHFEGCLERFPAHQVVVQLAADHYDRIEEPEQGNAAWRRAIEELPDALPLRTTLAERLEGQGDVEAAEAVLAEATELFDTAQAWYELSRLRHRAGRAEEALQAVESAIERSGDNERLRFERADLLVSLGRLEEAEQVMAGLEHREYKDVIRARLLHARGDSREALALVGEVLVLWPNNVGARHLAGRAAESIGDYDRALAEYRETFRADQTLTDAALSLARIYLARGDHREAQGWVRADLQRRPSGRKEARLLASRVAQAAGSPDAARSWLDKLAELPDADPVALQLERASLERQLTGPEASLALLESASAKLDLADPANAPLLGAAADDLLALDREKEALARVTKAVEANPDAPELQNLHGRVLLRTGRRPEAQAAFERALAVEADFAPALEGLAGLALTEGDAERAVELARRASQADPVSSDAAYLAAQALLSVGRRDEAKGQLRRTLALEPSHAAASNDLAWLLAESSEELDLALSLARRAVASVPRAETYDTLGWVQLRRGESAAAVKALQESLSLQESPSVRYRLGLALAEAGEQDEALLAFRRALEGGSFPEAEAARSQLARLEQHQEPR